MRRDKVIRVFDQLLLSDLINETYDGARPDHRQCDSTDAFKNRMSTFEQNADLKELMNPTFFHAYGPTWQSLEGMRKAIRIKATWLAKLRGGDSISLFCGPSSTTLSPKSTRRAPHRAKQSERGLGLWIAAQDRARPDRAAPREGGAARSTDAADAY